MFRRIAADARERPTTRSQTQRRSDGRVRSVPGAQTRLVVGLAGDAFEREADSIARRVVDSLSNVQSGVASAQPRGLFSPSLAGTRIRRRATVGAEGGALDATTERSLEAARRGGRPLDATVRHDMEGALGADFGRVRIHEGPSPSALNETMNARAFTLGSDIFMRNRLDATSSEGQETLAHELVHVVQRGAASTPRRLMRQIVKNTPTYEVRGESLAATMLRGVDKTELGLTIPSLNGTPFIGEGVQSNGMGSVAKPKVHLPDVIAEDSKGGIEYTNQHPTTLEEKWDPWAEEGADKEYEEVLHPEDERARKAYEAGRWLAWAEGQPRNVFDWCVQLPPAGPWREDGVAKAKLVELVKQIGELSKVAVPDAEALLQGETGSLIVTDPDGDAALLSHTRQHEHQHVGDHIGLINEMFGPWDTYSGSHATRATAIASDERTSALARFQTGGGFTPGADRIASEFGAEMIRSGTAYHREPEGSVPTITVHDVTADTVIVHIEPLIRLNAGAIPKARFIWGRTRISG
jgi:hypothetical protein